MVPIQVEFRHHMSRIGAITHSSHREEAVEPEVGDLEPPGTTVRRVQGVPLPPEMAWITFYGGIERFPRLSGGGVTTGHSAVTVATKRRRSSTRRNR